MLQFKGVELNCGTGRFQPRLWVDKVWLKLGAYDEAETAARQRDWIIIQMDLDKPLNFPREDYPELI